MSVRILVADDHGVLRAGLHVLLNAVPDFEVVGEAADGYQVLALVDDLQPDVVVLDINMPGPDGIEVTRRLKENSPHIHVLILTVHEDDGLLLAAIRAGASGYIVKRAVGTELVDAIYAVCRQELYVHPAMTRALLGDLQPSLISEQLPAETLTPRETEVLRLIAEGHTNRQVAEILSISVRTVESHRANLKGKLGCGSRVELVRYARQHNLL
ncbi:MAG: response regulator transcription factor [Anaerolineae bacterium]